ncbi:MAG: cytochrome c oxidase assembly protein [Actinobacteria bacterium]|nr:cytochrome c oxidase assembly protein [Actinomycetota bacterium]
MTIDLQFRLVPEITLGLLVLVGCYVYALSPLNPDRPPVPVNRWRFAAFAAGAAAVFVSLHPPIDRLAEAHFSMHMLQHVLLIFFAVPLLLMGTPTWLLAPVYRLRPVRWLVRTLTRLPVALALGPGAFWIWHVPSLYDLALRDRAMHDLEHLSMVAGATIMWWPVLLRVAGTSPGRRATHMLYLLVLTIPGALLSSIFVFASTPLYPWYATSLRVFDLSPLDDQRIGGLLMKLTGTFVIWGVLSVHFFRWMSAEPSPPPVRARPVNQS